MEIEEWNEYGELKEHVTMYYDEFTQPPISQRPKTPPPKPATSTKPSAITQTTEKITLPAPPSSAKSSSSVSALENSTVGKSTLPVRSAAGSIAEEAAKKAKEMRLQALREKVYGKDGKKLEEKNMRNSDANKNASGAKDVGNERKEESENYEGESDEKSEDDTEDDSDIDSEDESEPEHGVASRTKTPKSGSEAQGHGGTSSIQSPRSSTWKNRRSSSTGSAASDEMRAMLQSPNSTSWKPTDVNKPITNFAGAVVVSSASDADIAAVEKSETIPEVPEPDDSEEAREKAKQKAEEKARKKTIKAKERTNPKKDKDKMNEKKKSNKKDDKGKEKGKEKAKSKSISDKDKDKTKKKTHPGKESSKVTTK